MKKMFVLPLLLALLPACASESLPEPEPTLETPGAFIAVEHGPGDLSMSRTLETFQAQEDTILVLTDYDVAPASWEEAREIAMQPDLPIKVAVTAASGKQFSKSNYRVVWFRTLTEEEKERAE
jgi:hypothetical protein